MYLEKKLPSGVKVAIVVRTVTEDRLRTKCFRGTTLPLAGNFLRWNSAEELFRDKEVMERFLVQVDAVLSKAEFMTHGVNIHCSLPTGWESTWPKENYSEGDLEPFNLNRRSWGLRVKLCRIDLLAPQTNELTIVYEFKCEDDKVVAVIHSLYPGRDIGELEGDMTEREGRVFFDWNHPGAVF